MARESATVAINIENGRLIAIRGSVKGDQLEIGDSVIAMADAGLDLRDASAVGEWVAKELRGAGLYRTARRGGVVFAVPRGEVVLKRLSFPPNTAETDLPAMVSLQMSRQLTVASASSVVDFVPIPAAGAREREEARADQTAVLAGALQGDRVGWRRDVCRAAGVKLRRIALKASGAATLLSEASQRSGEATLGVSLGPGSTEFIVVEDGRLVFARATDLVRPDGETSGEFAQRVAVEAKRTWMSYRVTEDAAPIRTVTVLGDDALARDVVERCEEALDLPASTAGLPEFIRVSDRASEAVQGATAALIGLLAEPMVNAPRMDFASPRRAPDRREAVRKGVLAAAVIAVLLGGVAFTVYNKTIRPREKRLASLTAAYREAQDEYYGLLRDEAKLQHLKLWSGARVDWLAHLEHLNGVMPDPHQAQLTSIVGQGDSQVGFRRKGRSAYYEVGEWDSAARATFLIDGRMKSRQIRDDLRAVLVGDEVYVVSTRGPDNADTFSLSLATASARPPAEAEPASAPAEGEGEVTP